MRCPAPDLPSVGKGFAVLFEVCPGSPRRRSFERKRRRFVYSSSHLGCRNDNPELSRPSRSRPEIDNRGFNDCRYRRPKLPVSFCTTGQARRFARNDKTRRGFPVKIETWVLVTVFVAAWAMGAVGQDTSAPRTAGGATPR